MDRTLLEQLQAMYCFVFFRVLIGQLTSRAGGKKQVSLDERRLAVARFLAGTRASEMRMFLDLLLQPVDHSLKGDLKITVYMYSTAAIKISYYLA